MWRRERDSNPRYDSHRIHAFQACAFSRSATPPSARYLVICVIGRKSRASPESGAYITRQVEDLLGRAPAKTRLGDVEFAALDVERARSTER